MTSLFTSALRSTLKAGFSTGRRLARRIPDTFKLPAAAAAIVGKLKELAPYALIELILPGGSVMALLLWLYRRHRKAPAVAAPEMLALL